MRLLSIARVLAITLLGVSLASGQANNGRIEGNITDPTGALIPGVQMTATNIRTQNKFESLSGEQGQYVLTALPPGIYVLTAELAGFRKAEIQSIEVNVGVTVVQHIKLELGAREETVTVEAKSVTAQAADSEITRNVNIRDIDTLPQLARTPITLAAFQPGVQTNPGDVSFSRINGLRSGSNNSKLDGIDVNDSVVPRLGLSLTANNTDSIGEFKIVLGGGRAEYGRSAGAQVELVTRSGTNQFHGNGFDYLRNTDLNANDFFSNQSGSTRPKFIQNIFGGSFGGPVFKDKTFIFGNYQGRRTRQETVRNRTVYTDLARKGIFQWNAGGIQSFNFGAADPRGIGIDKGVAAINALMPLPNNFDVGDGLNTGGFRFNTPSNSFEDQYTIKADHNITNTNRTFFRWSWQRNSSIDTLNNAERTYPGQIDGTQGGHRWGFAVGDDWTIGRRRLIS
jgi:carboxypeptidase family protein